MISMGRKKIFTDEPFIDESNIIKVLQECVPEHDKNMVDIKYLFDYEKGIQPILERIKEIRPEINIRLVENNAAKITDFKVGYEFGSPITYVQRAKKQIPQTDTNEDDARITVLNDMLVEQKKASKDTKLARDFKICGVGYRMIYPKHDSKGKSVFDVITLNPLTTFVVYSNDIYQQPVLGVTFTTTKYGKRTYGCYTKDRYFEVSDGMKIINGIANKDYAWELTNGVGEYNEIGRIPIVEYECSCERMGCFEKAIPIIDTINIVNSDRANDVAQHVQSLLWMHNAELPEGVDLTNNPLIETKSPANGVQPIVKYLSEDLKQAEIQTFIDHLIKEMQEISGVPTLGISNGGSTGSATQMSNGWSMAEDRALEAERLFENSEQESIEIMLEIIKKSGYDEVNMNDIESSDIGIKFTRNKTYDLSTKAATLATLLNSGIDLLHALRVIDLFPDPQAVYNDSKEMVEKLRNTKQQENTVITGNEAKNEIDKDRIIQDSSDQYQNSPSAKL